MNPPDIKTAVAYAKQRWPGSEFVISRKKKEAHGKCPICNRAEHDGFIIFESGRYLCRPGGCEGWVDEDEPRVLTQAEKNAIEIDNLKRKQQELEKRLSVLERMHQCTDHLDYHRALDDDARRYWHGQGIYDEAINRYLLGLCYRCPTDREHRASWTIPVFTKGELVNIRHRLFNADGDKYRPHMAGLGNTLFNSDNLYNGQPDVMIVEGEKKSICVSQYDINTVGIMGKAGFPPAWAAAFKTQRTVYVALDPDAQDNAHKLAALFPGRGRVVTLPEKADDFFVMGGKPQEFREYMRQARRVD